MKNVRISKQNMLNENMLLTVPAMKLEEAMSADEENSIDECIHHNNGVPLFQGVVSNAVC